MFRHFKHFSLLIAACALTVSLLLSGIAAAQAEWETLKFTNAAEDLWAGETYITGRDVNMRSGPDTAAESQGFFRFGEPVRIKEDLGDWYKVECRYNVVPHFVYKKYVGSWSDVKAKFIPGSDCMMQIDKLYDCLNMAAPFNIKGLDRERKLKEIDHYLDVIDKTYNYIESSKLPPEAIKDMCQAVDLIEDMFKCQRRFVTEPEQAANMRDEAYPDLQEYFQKLYATLEKYR